MNKHCVDWLFNARQLQSVISSYCGFYCCFYCVLRCRGVDLARIVNSFTSDTGFNDSIVRNFVCDGVATFKGDSSQNVVRQTIQLLRTQYQDVSERRPH